MQSIVEILAQELGQKQQYIENVVNLIDEGNTIPFIARYRKEMHSIVNRRTKLNRTDYNRRNKWEFRSRIIWDPHIDKNCKFNNTY